MNDYEQNFNSLNTAQKQAVEAIEGPVLVIAGPGTGKTQLLSMRVANILHKTDTDPRNVLCLTFTNKAATNMRERLQRLIGPHANHVKIKTFHALSAEIMNKYPEFFWNGAQLTSAPDVVQHKIIQEVISGLPISNPFSIQFYGVFTMAHKAQKSISLAKEAGLTPEKLKTIIEANLAHLDVIEPLVVDAFSKTLNAKSLPEIFAKIRDLPKQGIDQFTSPIGSMNTAIEASLKLAMDKDAETGKASNTSRWKSSWITNENGHKGLHKERRRNEWWLALVGIYSMYREKLHKSGYYDYSDMLLEVITQIEQNESLRAEIQEQYHYILIDEFQDSNAAQLRLSHLIADHSSAEGKPNIMAVGDDDQSIYAFNGAEIGNLLHFNRSYGTESVTTIVLTDNYRSTQAILDSADKIIAHCEDRLVGRIPGITKNLTSQTKQKTKSRIEHLIFTDIDQQLHGISQDIRKELTNKPGQSIAVLARSHKSLHSIAASLANSGVSISYEQQTNILQNDIVKLVIDVCRMINFINTGDINSLNVLISNIITHPIFEISPISLWEIAKENLRNPNWFESIQQRDDTSEFAKWVLDISRNSRNKPLGMIIEDILGIGESPPRRYVNDYIGKNKDSISVDYIQTLSAIQHLRKLVAEFTPQNEPTINDLISYVDTKINAGQPIPNPYSLISDVNSVTLLTVHKAKGLEFDTVYVIDTTDDNWSPSRSTSHPPINLPLSSPLESHNDYARLMYVAATRAKQNLIFTSFNTSTDEESILPTPLIEHIDKSVVKQTQNQLVESLQFSLRWPRLTAKSEKQVLSGVLDYFTINVTNLINFLDVTTGGPANFLARNLLHLPETKNASMMHGTAMHSALEFAQVMTNKTGNTPNINDIKHAYTKSLSKEYLTVNDMNKYTEHGHKVIDRLINTHKYQFIPGNRPEFVISDTFIGEARVGGKLDRIDFLPGNKMRIVDYKTGNSLASFETRDKNKQIKAWKHKLQLVFYALLAQHHPELSRYPDPEGQMVYVESDTSRHLTISYIPNDTETERLARIVESVWKHIQDFDLPDVSEFSKDISGIHAFEEYLLNI